MTKFSIAVIGCRFNHPLGERVLCMWRHLAKEYGVKVHIITTDRWIDTKGDSKLKNSKNLKIHKLKTIGAKYGQFKHSMPGLINKLTSLDPDIIYAQEEPIQMGVTYPAFLMAKILKKPFVFFTWENKLQKWFWPISFIEDSIIKGSDLILAGTLESNKVLLKKGADPNKIRIVPETGIDTELFKPKNIYKNKKTILYIGRLVKEKGINVLLKVRQHLIKKHGKRYNYIFVGNGPLRNKLEKLAKKNKDIILPKPTPYKKVPELYHLGDIFFYASLRTKKWEEQYGYSMLEALSSGLPVISTQNISGPKAIVKCCVNGHLIEEGNWEEAAVLIDQVLEDPGILQAYKKRARQDAISRLSKEAIAKRTFEVLEDIHKQWIYNQ